MEQLLPIIPFSLRHINHNLMTFLAEHDIKCMSFNELDIEYYNLYQTHLERLTPEEIRTCPSTLVKQYKDCHLFLSYPAALVLQELRVFLLKHPELPSAFIYGKSPLSTSYLVRDVIQLQLHSYRISINTDPVYCYGNLASVAVLSLTLKGLDKRFNETNVESCSALQDILEDIVSKLIIINNNEGNVQSEPLADPNDIVSEKTDDMIERLLSTLKELNENNDESELLSDPNNVVNQKTDDIINNEGTKSDSESDVSGT